MKNVKYALVLVIILACTAVIFCECPDWESVLEVEISKLGGMDCIMDCNGVKEKENKLVLSELGGSESGTTYCRKRIASEGETTSTTTTPNI